jgi:phospholipid-translocating ATPase
MLDGLYQSVIVFYMTYLLFAPANFVTKNGLNIDDTKRIGVFIATIAVIVVNVYVLMNTYRWDWLMLLIVSISILLIWFWTGVWTSTTSGFTFHGAAGEVYGQLNFWALVLLTVIICLLPRFSFKAIQKIYFPRDVDIIREQVRQGKFDYLNDPESTNPDNAEKRAESLTSLSEGHADGIEVKRKRTDANMSEDLRPIYPPSVAPTTTTHNRTTTGSDGTDYTNHSLENPNLDRSKTLERLERPIGPVVSREVSRPSFDRARMSMDRIRPSFEQSRDFTSASRLMRLESSQSAGGGNFRWARRLTRASEKGSEHTRRSTIGDE